MYLVRRSELKTLRTILIILFVGLIVVWITQIKAEPTQFFEDNSSRSRKELFDKGTFHLKQNNPDSALAYYVLASRRYESPQLSSSEKEICAKSLTNAGYVYFFFFNDYAAAYSSFLSSNEIAANENLMRLKCMNNLNIGNIFSIYDDYDSASKFYKEAFATARKNGYDDLKMTAFVDLADIYFNEQGTVDPIWNEIIAIGKDTLPENHPLTSYTRNIYNGLRSVRTNNSDAEKWFDRAKDSVGKILLGERYGYNADFMVSKVLQLEGKPSAAAARLKNVLADSLISANRDIEAMACQRISEYYREASKSDSAQLYKIKYLELSDSIFTTQKLTAVKDLTAAHERMKFSARISYLSESRAFLRLLLICISVALAIVVFLMLWIVRKQRLLKFRNDELYKRNRELLEMSERGTLPLPEVIEPDDLSGLTEENMGLTEENIDKASSNELKGKLSPDSEFIAELNKKIVKVMESDEIFSPDFNASRLATLCDTNSRYLSAALSATESGTLPALLARYRVNEAMRRLADINGRYGNLTIEAVGESVGFKTRSTFSSTFKKVTGLTPKEYRQISIEKSRKD